MPNTKVFLGGHLFCDGRLSRDTTMACTSCHEQSAGFTDGRPKMPSPRLTSTTGPPLAWTVCWVTMPPQAAQVPRDLTKALVHKAPEERPFEGL
ncbi:MAG: cytochrome c peroxidase [Devosia sp.]